MLKNAFQIDKLAVRWFSVEESIEFYTPNNEKYLSLCLYECSPPRMNSRFFFLSKIECAFERVIEADVNWPLERQVSMMVNCL